MDGVPVHLVVGSRLIYAKLCGTANLAPSHRPYTRISWVCSVTQANTSNLSKLINSNYLFCHLFEKNIRSSFFFCMNESRQRETPG